MVFVAIALAGAGLACFICLACAIQVTDVPYDEAMRELYRKGY